MPRVAAGYSGRNRCCDRETRISGTIRVGIVDDHPIVRSAMRGFLALHADIDVVGEAGSGALAVELVREGRLDVLLLDLMMPGSSGIEVLPRLRARDPDLGILVLSGCDEAQYAVNLVRQGASGYLNKLCDPDEIVTAIRVIHSGKRYFTTAVADLMASELDRPKDAGPPHQRLSKREFQVFLRLAAGKTSGEVAEILSLSVKAVSTYRLRVMGKLGTHSNSELTRYALQHRLLE